MPTQRSQSVVTRVNDIHILICVATGRLVPQSASLWSILRNQFRPRLGPNGVRQGVQCERTAAHHPGATALRCHHHGALQHRLPDGRRLASARPGHRDEQLCADAVAPRSRRQSAHSVVHSVAVSADFRAPDVHAALLELAGHSGVAVFVFVSVRVCVACGKMVPNYSTIHDVLSQSFDNAVHGSFVARAVWQADSVSRRAGEDDHIDVCQPALLVEWIEAIVAGRCRDWRHPYQRSESSR